MSARDDHDARAFSRGAAAIEAQIDAPVALQVQHIPARAGFGGLCGSYTGQVAWKGIGATCAACLALKKGRKTR